MPNLSTKNSLLSYKALIALFLFAIILKLPLITAPISDWHSWNQISTMSMSRYIYLEGWPVFFKTKVDLFEYLSTSSNQAFAEFPIIEGVISGFYHIFGGESEWAARLAVILFSAIGSIYFFLLVSEECRHKTAVIASGMYLISPMVWYYHRTIMTDVVMVSLVIAGLYHFRKWIFLNSYRHLLICTVYTACAALAKAYGLYIGVAYLLIILDHWGWKKLIQPGHFILLVGSCAPILIWIWFGLSLSAEVDGRNLSGSTELLGAISIWWNPKYWLRLQSSIMDFTLLPLGNLGLIAAFVYYRKLWQHRIAVFWFASVFFYFLFVRQGNLEHDYYQMPFAAPVIFIASLGWDQWSEYWKKKINTKTYYALVGLISLLCIVNGAKYVHTKSRIDPSPVVLGKKISSLSAAGEFSIIVDSDPLQRNQAIFYAKTKGWFLSTPPSVETLQQYIDKGGTWLGLSLSLEKEEKYKYRIEEYRNVFKLNWQDVSTDRYQNPKNIYLFNLVTR